MESSGSFEIVAKTIFGLEDVLAKEIKAIGGKDIQKLNRAIKYRGDKRVLYKSNLHLRTAIKILKPIDRFMAFDEIALYKKIKRIDWTKFLTVDQTFAIDGTTHGNTFTHSKYVALKVKDAIADHFREKFDKRPSVNTKSPDLRINIQIADKQCIVSLDSSGESLNKRGYRVGQNDAPINEVLAAGMIALSGWKGNKPFLDPMCGSGTIAIEAAMIANNIAPGRNRQFTFEMWSDFDQSLWKALKEEATQKITKNPCFITGRDVDRSVIKIAEENARKAGVDHKVTFKTVDFTKSSWEREPGIIVINPPYGERLKEREEIIPFYGEIGSKLKHSYENFDAWIISSNLRGLKFVGLKPSKKIKLYNGSLECSFNKYELYRGSKKNQ